MPVPENTLDPADYVIFPNVFVIDEFVMTDDDGEPVAHIDAQWIGKCCERMNEREATTGDLAPHVVGHTKDDPEGDDEDNGPPLVGYYRNWKQLPFFDTGRTGAAPDLWIMKSELARAAKFPRRSSEVWVNRYEIDPVSALGATTPARDLGMLMIKLSRGGDAKCVVAYEGGLLDRPVRLERTGHTSPTNRETDMPEDNKDKGDKGASKPAADPSQSGSSKSIEGKLDMLIDLITKLTSGAGGAGAAAAPVPGADTGAAGGGAGGEQPLTDEELDQYLSQNSPGLEGEGDDEASRKGEKPVKNDASYGGGDNTNVMGLAEKKKLQRQGEEIQVLRVKLARFEVEKRLNKAVNEEGASLDPNDEKLITSLVIMPDDIREDMIVRLSRNKSKAGPARGHAASALNSGDTGVTGGGARKRTPSQDDRKAIMKLARQKNIDYTEAADELGFAVGLQRAGE